MLLFFVAFSPYKKIKVQRKISEPLVFDMAEWLGFEPRRGLTPLTI